MAVRRPAAARARPIGFAGAHPRRPRFLSRYRAPV